MSVDTHTATASGVKPRASWRSEPWPWLLMAGPLVVVVASFITLWLAISSDDGMVADDYYQRGLAINRTIDRAEYARAAGLSARVTLGADARHVSVKLVSPDAAPVQLRLRLVHPTRETADEVLTLDRGANGGYEGVLPRAVSGRRVLTLEDSARHWRLAAEATIHPNAMLELTPQ
jgi:hypothetical protein